MDALALILDSCDKIQYEGKYYKYFYAKNKKLYLVDKVKNRFCAANYFRAVNLQRLTLSSDF